MFFFKLKLKINFNFTEKIHIFNIPLASLASVISLHAMMIFAPLFARSKAVHFPIPTKKMSKMQIRSISFFKIII